MNAVAYVTVYITCNGLENEEKYKDKQSKKCSDDERLADTPGMWKQA